MADDPNTPDPDAPDDTPDPTDPPDDLGENGVAALRAERSGRRTAEAALRAAQQELADARSNGLSAIETAKAEAKAEARADALAESNERIIRAEVKAAAAGRLRRPEYATRLLDLTKFTVADDGSVPEDAITSAIDELVQQDPDLAIDGRPVPLPGGGARPTSGTSMDDVIRRAAGRR